MKRVVSYSFFRSEFSAYEHPNCGEARGRVFVNYLRLIVRAHHAVWGKGWELRFYHDDRVMEFPYFKAMQAMADQGLLRLIYFGKSETLCGVGGMLERLRPAWEPDVEYCVCRDVDSIPMPRDRRAVEEFVASGKAVHVIHDAGAHSGVMGGTLTVKAPAFRNLVWAKSLEEFIEQRGQGIDFRQHGADQNLLNRYFETFAHDTLIHELHHLVGDMPGAEIRTRIDHQTPDDIWPQVAAFGDTFSKVIGGCSDVEAPFAFYQQLRGPDHEYIPDPRPEWLMTILYCEQTRGINL